MAFNYARETQSNLKKITVLAAANNFTSTRLSDQNVYKFGTNRRSEILGIIGNTGETYENIYNSYINSL
jgi:hypothetical protein